MQAPTPQTITEKPSIAQLSAFLESNPNITKDDNLASKNANLGNNANNCPTNKKMAVSPEAEKVVYEDKQRLYRELNHAQLLLTEANVLNSTKTNPHRTRYCHNVRAHQADSIAVKAHATQRKARLAGVQTCGSVWSCPVCASRIAQKRADEIKTALEYARAHGLIPIMITLTVRHNRWTKLDWLIEKLKLCYDGWNDGGSMYRVRKKLGWVATIKAIEVTHGDNGFHPHIHLLMLIDPKKLMDAKNPKKLEDTMANSWLFQLEKHGLSGIKDVAFNIQTHGQVSEHYLAKLGVSNHKEGVRLQHEMTGSKNKKSSRHIWDIIKDNMREHSSKHNMKSENARLYIEYVQAMSGTKFITWTNGFKDICGVNDIEDEQAGDEIAELEQSEMIELCKIDDHKFRAVRVFRAVPRLLDVASNTKDGAKVLEFVDELYEKLVERDNGFMAQKDFNLYIKNMTTIELASLGRKYAVLEDNARLELRRIRDTGDKNEARLRRTASTYKNRRRKIKLLLKQKQKSLF